MDNFRYITKGSTMARKSNGELINTVDGLNVDGSSNVIQTGNDPFSEETVSLSNTESSSFSIVEGVVQSTISVEGGSVRFWVSGAEPTSNSGHLVQDGGTITLDNPNQIKKFKAIAVSNQAILQVSHFKKVAFEDAVPPAVPKNIITEPRASSVHVKWDGNTEPDLDGYNVYVDNQKHNADIIKETDYLVTPLSNTVSIVVAAVDTNGNERKSPEIIVTPLPPEYLAYDTFNRADTTNESLGNTEDLFPKPWENLRGKFAVRSNQAKCVNTESITSGYMAAVDVGVAGVEIEVEGMTGPNANQKGFGLAFLANDGGNFYAVRANDDDGKVGLIKRVGGTFANVQTFTPNPLIGYNEKVKYKVRVSESSKKTYIYISGDTRPEVLLGEYQISDTDWDALTGRKCGIYVTPPAHISVIGFDNFKVKEYKGV